MARTKQQTAIAKWNRALFNEGVRQGKSKRLNTSYEEAKSNVKKEVFGKSGLGAKPKRKKATAKKTTARKAAPKTRKTTARKTTAKRKTSAKRK